jgi:hypothetical protein
MTKFRKRKLNTLPLASRLFISHLVVMIVGILSFIAINKVSSHNFFIFHLKALEEKRFYLVEVRAELIDGFEYAWRRGTLWSVLVGTTAAVAFSYWVSRRIILRLTEMEQITQRFASGDFNARVPLSDIPEFNRLGISFNRMAASLEGVEVRRRDLVSDMTHELRTPLTVVRGYLEEMANGEIQSSPEIYRQLVKETKRLERLVNDLQELSASEAGYLTININKIDLRPLIESLIQKFSDQLLEDGPVLLLESPPQIPLVRADIDRTEQILVNLLGNAIRYTPAGSITLNIYIEVFFLWIEVIDTGIGIASEDLPHVYERFWRAEKSRNRYSGGTGIGLAITKRLVELQGGQIQVESKLDIGSTFRFSLPIA